MSSKLANMADKAITKEVLDFLSAALKMMGSEPLSDEEFVARLENMNRRCKVGITTKIIEFEPDEVDAILLDLSLSIAIDKKINAIKDSGSYVEVNSPAKMRDLIYCHALAGSCGRITQLAIVAAYDRALMAGKLNLGQGIAIGIEDDALCLCHSEKNDCFTEQMFNPEGISNVPFDLEKWNPKKIVYN